MNFARMVDCFDQQLCQDLIQHHHQYNPAFIIDKKGECIPSSLRSNSSSQIEPAYYDTVVSHINAAVSAYSAQLKREHPQFWESLPLPGISAGLETWMEHPSLLRYEEGQAYGWHVDQRLTFAGGGSECQADNRLISAVVYLNDDFEGGETEMFGRTWAPKAGQALFFPSSWTYPHQALPVISGTKYAIVTWYHCA